MKKESKTIVFKDHAMITEKKELTLKAKDQLQSLVNEYLSLNIIGEKGLNESDLPSLLDSPDTFVKAQAAAHINEMPNFSGFQMKTEALLNNLELPDTNTLKDLAHQLNDTLRKGVSLSIFKLSDSKVSIDKDAIVALDEKYTVYAETPAQIEAHAVLSNFVKSLADLNTLVKKNLGSNEVQVADPKRFARYNHELQNFDFDLQAYQRLLGQTMW